MTISDIIQVIAVVVSIITSAVSIRLSRIAIQQSAQSNAQSATANEQNALSIELTKQAAEDMARPYVNVYVEAFAVKSQQRVYTFKNFGQTPAYITNIDVQGAIGDLNKYKFQSLVGNMLAPNQKVTSNIEEGFKGCANVTIFYKDINGNSYQDTFKLDTQAFEDFAYTTNEANKSDEIPSAIRQSTMALLRDLK